MNKKYLYLIISLLLCTSVFLAYQVTQASPAIPNPGHGTSDLEGDASLDMNNNKIINLSSPTADSDASTKGYADAAGPGTVITPMCGWITTGGPPPVGSCTPGGCPGGFSDAGVSCWVNSITRGGYGYNQLFYWYESSKGGAAGACKRICYQ